jgi:tRNA dimethylallyltransferase
VVDAVLLLGGPTCSGKTALALELAERFDAEIVGADSRQIYRDMPIGTAAPTAAERARVPHHLVGFLDPHERYSAARYVRDALAAIGAIRARRKRAIVVGGTGFYLRALAGDVALSSAYDPLLRARLAREARLHPPATLHAWLAVRAPQRAAAISERDPYRITRALEIALAAPGQSVSSAVAAASLRGSAIPYRKVALEVAPEVLDGRIEARVDAMLAAGLVAEAERVGAEAAAADAVGYPQALAYLAGSASARELRALLIRATRRYAKRQKTWFRSEPDVEFLGPEAVEGFAISTLGWAP